MSFDECDLVDDFGIFSAKDICEAPLYLVKFCNDRLDEARRLSENSNLANFRKTECSDFKYLQT